MNKAKFIIVSCILLTGSLMESRSQITIGSTEVDTSILITGLDTPWEILWGPDNMIWMTEREGRVSRVDPETGHREVLLDLTGTVVEGSENGMLGMVLHPNFMHPDSQFVYLVYTYYTTANLERLVRYTFDSDTLVDELILLDHIPAAYYHIGSRVIILPDRTLLMSTGDAGSGSYALDTNLLQGKFLRLNLDGSVPDDNPIPGSYVWSLGHRNPQGLVRAPSGIIYSSEHGPSNDDELNIIEKGRNYGWPEVEGFCDLPAEQAYCTANNVKEPLVAWTPTLAVCGIDYYDHGAIPEWKHSILMTTLKESDLRVLKLNASGDSILSEEVFFDNEFGRLRDICISPDGRIFLATSNQDGRANSPFPIPGDDRIVEVRSLNAGLYCYAEQLATICQGETFHFHGLEISQPGIYTDTIPGEGGCDTIVSLRLDIEAVFNDEQEIRICEGDSVLVNGEYLSAAGVYADTLSTLYGCDSIVTTRIFYSEAGGIVVEDSVMVDLDDTVTITATAGFVSYQWNDDPSSAENTIMVIAGELGEGVYAYTLEVEDANGCILADTVIITVAHATGIESPTSLNISIFPNPVAVGELNVNYAIASEGILMIYNQMGKEVVSKILSPMNNRIKVTLPEMSGIYLLKIESMEGTGMVKVLKH